MGFKLRRTQQSDDAKVKRPCKIDSIMSSHNDTTRPVAIGRPAATARLDQVAGYAG
jgi:hypothetical protein